MGDQFLSRCQLICCFHQHFEIIGELLTNTVFTKTWTNKCIIYEVIHMQNSICFCNVQLLWEVIYLNNHLTVPLASSFAPRVYKVFKAENSPLASWLYYPPLSSLGCSHIELLLFQEHGHAPTYGTGHCSSLCGEQMSSGLTPSKVLLNFTYSMRPALKTLINVINCPCATPLHFQSLLPALALITVLYTL